MEAVLMYSAKASLLLLLFYFSYFLMIRKNTFHQGNRIFLLTALILAIFLPLVPLKFQVNKFVGNDIAVSVEKGVLSNENSSEEQYLVYESNHAADNFDKTLIFNLLGLVYLSGLLFCIIKLMSGCIKMVKIRKLAKSVKIFERTYFLQPNQAPFTFFQWVFIPSKKVNSSILAHEEVHREQMHSLDLLIVDLAKCIMWFNPLVYLLRKDIVNLHEFIADEAVCKQLKATEKVNYMELLYAYSHNFSQCNLTSNFHTNLKQRIKMMTGRKSHSLRKWNYLVAFPLVGLALLISASKEANKTQLMEEQALIETTNESTLSQKFELILPIAQDDLKVKYGNNFFCISVNSHNPVIFAIITLSNSLSPKYRLLSL